jgi:hypothetical protein
MESANPQMFSVAVAVVMYRYLRDALYRYSLRDDRSFLRVLRTISFLRLHTKYRNEAVQIPKTLAETVSLKVFFRSEAVQRRHATTSQAVNPLPIFLALLNLLTLFEVTSTSSAKVHLHDTAETTNATAINIDMESH